MSWLTLLLVPVVAFAVWYATVVVRGIIKDRKRHPAERFGFDASTPHGALRLYQRSVEQHDIEAMVAAKDFLDEAEVMLGKLGKAFAADAALIQQTAETLELAFRDEWKNATWPPLDGASSFFSEALDLSPTVRFVTHRLVYASGEIEESHVRLVRRGAFWKVSHAPI